MFEHLESRRLLSITVQDGRMLVVGTETHDRVTVRALDAVSFLITINGQTTGPYKELKAVRFDLRGGDDRIDLRKMPLQAAGGVEVDGGSGSDVIIGGRANDSVRGGAGDDRIDGGDGSNVLQGDQGNDIISTLGIANTLLGGAGDDHLLGGTQDDTLFGNDGDDTLYANEGNDLLNGGLGSDILHGGAGVDTADYHSQTAPLVITVDNRPNDGLERERDNVRATIERIISGSGNDRISHPGNGMNNTAVFGRGGDDTLSGASRLVGGLGNDMLISSSHPQLIGGEGDDILQAEQRVRMEGGPGNDTLAGGSGPDYLDGGEGNNLLSGNAGNDTLTAGRGRDTIRGGLDHDEITYNDRQAGLSLTLDGIANDGEPGEGDNVHIDIETLIGGAGDDLIVGNELGNILIGGDGTDTLRGGAGNDALYDGPICRRRRGVPSNGCFSQDHTADQLFGEAGNDALTAYAGADSIFGGDGDDFFSAAADYPPNLAQFIDGGSGADRAHINPALDHVENVETVL